MDKDKLHFKVNVPGLFSEIVTANNNNSIFKHPLIITDNILRAGAKRAMELQDEQMIAIFARLAMYEGCADTLHPDYEKLMELASKRY